jgi:helicase required for RNAi-mediated heterochromatin assembly 1
MVTNKVAIVQGPPGTGKTFTSIAAIKVMLSNLQPEDPPMIIAAQTNHALDQLMNQLLASEKNVVRLGGRCDKENVNIIKRTLYELRMTTKDVPGGGKGLKDCRTALQHKINEIELLMSPLLAGTLLTDEILIKYRLITEAQKESLYENGWFETGGSEKVDDSQSTSISTCKWFPFCRESTANAMICRAR